MLPIRHGLGRGISNVVLTIALPRSGPADQASVVRLAISARVDAGPIGSSMRHFRYAAICCSAAMRF
ncbi:MAG: hypothetical protein M3440_10695, partial [Chloroflexota bacterium]|nr:hypothetical protein [Chloroflexota bacterium]